MILYVLAGMILLAVFFWWQNNGIVVTQLVFKSSNLPHEFDGYKILHVSDLHNKSFGEGQKKIVKIMAKTHPDMIAITGDIIDKRREGTGAALMLASQATKIAPVYYVPGNHEKTAGIFEKLSAKLKACGVFVIAGDDVQIKRNGATITIMGVKDWQFYHADKDDTPAHKNAADKRFFQKLSTLAKAEGFQLLLSHRPEKIKIYEKLGSDLVLTGHAHGGQWRLPLIGGLYAPHQGVFPKYTSGLYLAEKTGMVVSRGLGNSAFPIRLFNRPELVVITLKRA